MNKVYPDAESRVNPAILGIPLEVAQDQKLTDGAVLLFGEIYGLIRAYGICNALDAHFQERRGKSRSAIQAQLKELREHGYIYILGDKRTRREIRIPQRFLGGKDVDAGYPENETPRNERCPENETPDAERCPENETGGCPENETHKTPESEEQKESKNTDSESFKSRSFCNSLSDQDKAKAQSTWEIFKDHKANGSLDKYEGLLLKCQGRQECFDFGVLSARKALDAKKLGSPIAFIRSVMDKHLVSDKDKVLELLDALLRNYETPEQRREIDARERRLATEKAANQSPPPAKVESLLQGATKPMPASGDVQTRINALNAFDQSQIKHIANRLAQEVNPDVARRGYANPERQALAQSLMSKALDEWEREQAEKPKPFSREELRASIKNGKLVR